MKCRQSTGLPYFVLNINLVIKNDGDMDWTHDYLVIEALILCKIVSHMKQNLGAEGLASALLLSLIFNTERSSLTVKLTRDKLRE